MGCDRTDQSPAKWEAFPPAIRNTLDELVINRPALPLGLERKQAENITLSSICWFHAQWPQTAPAGAG